MLFIHALLSFLLSFGAHGHISAPVKHTMDTVGGGPSPTIPVSASPDDTVGGGP